MDMRENKLLGDLLLKEGILEDITSFIIHYMESGHVSRSCECVKDFWTPLLMHAPDLDGRASTKMALLSQS